MWWSSIRESGHDKSHQEESNCCLSQQYHQHTTINQLSYHH